MEHVPVNSLPDPVRFIDQVVRAVLAEGARLRAEFHRPEGPRGHGSKAEIDTEIEAQLKRVLLSVHDCDWHGEELSRRRTGHADTWIVDPHDGTRAFLEGLRGSAISVALVRQGRPVLGVVHAPMAPDDAGDLFWWVEGRPAFRNGVAMEPLGSCISTAGNRRPAQGTQMGPMLEAGYGPDTILCMNEDAADFARANHERFAPASVLAIPSIAYRLALAAAGEVDAAISLTHGLDAYDIAGGHALLSAVGGSLVQLNGQPVSYDTGMSYRGCVGGRPEVIDEVCLRRPGHGSRVKRHGARPVRRTACIHALRGAHGTLLGQLAGDALGSAVEFQSPDQINRQYPDGVTELRAGGTWNLLAGQPTDDSEMALALARAILAAGGFDMATVADAYLAWGSSGPFDMGGTTRDGLDALEGRGRPRAESQSNGALMRVSPIGILAAGRPELAASLARDDARLTHPNPVCIAASAAFAAAVAAGIAGADSRTMWSVAHANAENGPGGTAVRKCLEKAMEEPPTDFMRNQGWVLIALGNAFHRLWTCQPLEPALIDTVAAGGDTDTNAAICGALLGAAQGRDAVPVRWRRRILACRAVDARDVRSPRPFVYWPDDALDLAEALLVLGTGDRQRDRI